MGVPSVEEQPTLAFRILHGTAAGDPPPQVAGYEILREIGRGGMGVVYLARQKTLNRLVALKMILGGSKIRPQEHARFLAEAEVIANLAHPNIVQIYEIGEAAGRPFFSLEYVDGGTLAQRLRGVPLPPAQAARLVADLARAVDAAHRQGVVHRDLKPANILMAGAPDVLAGLCTPKITDFGLAKRLDSGVKTTTGFILGTPCYMAPEQAAGKVDEVESAADVYSLGAILYELLTGRPPFQGETPLVTMQQVLCDDPVAPTKLQRQAPVELEIICLKCLQKEPNKRYGAGGALADDLQRFLEGRPILARPASPGERLVKWSRRRPSTAAFVSASLLTLMLLLAGGVWHTLQLRDALAATDGARLDAQTERDASLQAKRIAEDREGLVQEFVFAAHVRLAKQFWDHADLQLMRDLLALDAGLESAGGREFTWRYLRRLSHSDRNTLSAHVGDVYSVVYSPDGKSLATASKDHTLRLWDATTGRARAILRGHDEEVNWAAFSPDGALLVSAGDEGRIILWDVATGRERRRLQESGDAVTAAAWASTGRWLATAGRDEMIHLWDMQSGKEQFVLSGHTKPVESLAFSPDGRSLASAGQDGGVWIWDVESRQGRGLSNYDSPPFRISIQTVAWSRDGRRLAAAGGDGTVRLWDAEGWKPRPPLLGHIGEVQGAGFSADGRVVASCGNDHTVRLWDVESGALLNVLKGHSDRVWCVTFSPDGRTVASAGRDGTVKLWNPALGQDWQALPVDGARVTAAAVSARTGALALGKADGNVELRPAYSISSAEVLPQQNSSSVNALVFSPDGQRLAVQDSDGTVFLWDVKERRPRTLRHGAVHGGATLSFSADGRTLASLTRRGPVEFWDAATGEAAPLPVVDTQEWTCLAFSPAGGLLAAATAHDFDVVLYDLKTGRRRTMSGHKAPVLCLAFSADGKTLVSGGMDQTAKLWDVQTGREKASGFLGHADAVASVAIHPNGKTVVTGGGDHTIRLWDAGTGQELATLPPHAGRVHTVAFTPEGNAMISAADGAALGELRFWSADEPDGSPAGGGRRAMEK